jgi:hypothetical protein
VRAHRPLSRFRIALLDCTDDRFMFAMNCLCALFHFGGDSRRLKTANSKQWIEITTNNIREPSIPAALGNLDVEVIVSSSIAENATETFFAKSLLQFSKARA